ncbi:MAG: hypothetical protein JW750_08600 [Anaerolineaceae bacterium]|nr:hypothetical protein [Anaerolineaceae bacterium]
MMTEITLKQTLYLLRRFWWVVLILTLLGAAAGWLFSVLVPPIYQGGVKIPVVFRPEQTGDLDELELDVAMSVLGQLLGSDAVFEQSVDRLADQDIQVSVDDLRDRAYLELRKDTFWLLVRMSDPEISSAAASAWGEAGKQLLDRADQAARAYHEMVVADAPYQSCFSDFAAETNGYLCSQDDLALSFSAANEASGEELLEQNILTQGLLYGTWVGEVEELPVSQSIAQFSRIRLVAAGAVIGFLLGLLLLLIAYMANDEMEPETR